MGEATARERVIAAYRLGVGALVVVALVGQYVHSARVPGFSPLNYVSFFTNLSNLIGAAVFLWSGIALLTARTGPSDLVRGAPVVYLVITGVVYAALLTDVTESLGLVLPWVNVVLHRLTPLVFAADWLLDPPRRGLPVRRALRWLAFPVAYLVYSLIRGGVVHWYPYPFLNPDTVGGAGGVAAYCLGVAAAFVLVTVVVTWAGNRLGARTGPRRSRADHPRPAA